MRRKFYISGVIIVVIAFLWWLQYENNKAFMNELLIHKPIPSHQVEAIHIWVKDIGIEKVPTEEYIKVVEWFNQYEADSVSVKSVPISDAQIILDTKDWATIIIHYIDGEIYVSRNDVGEGGIAYIFLDDAPEIEAFFEKLITEKMTSNKTG